MEIKEILHIVGFLVTLLSTGGALWWAIIKELRKVREDNVQNYHLIDKRIHGVEIVVTPYAEKIATIERNQTTNMVAITELRAALESLNTDKERLQRELENIRNMSLNKR